MWWLVWSAGVCVIAGLYGGVEMGAVYAAAFCAFFYAASR